jgi:CheY-like chemotaxis protein
MRSGYVSRVCTMSSRLGIRSKPDDNESVADRLAFLLDCYGHHAAVAYNGETALRLLRTGAFEITFLDENLPDIKGSAVAWSLRETPIRSAASLVSMTGDAVSQGDIARLFDVYLQKPFSCEALMQVIEDARCSSDANTRQAA